MELVSGIVLYFMIWWVVLLLLLPVGFVPQDKVETGHARSAPASFSFKKKALLTTGVSFGVFLVLYWFIDSGIFSFRDIVAQNPKW